MKILKMALSTHNPSIVTIHTHFEFISLLISIQYFFQVLDNYLFICYVLLYLFQMIIFRD